MTYQGKSTWPPMRRMAQAPRETLEHYAAERALLATEPDDGPDVEQSSQ